MFVCYESLQKHSNVAKTMYIYYDKTTVPLLLSFICWSSQYWSIPNFNFNEIGQKRSLGLSSNSHGQLSKFNLIERNCYQHI